MVRQPCCSLAPEISDNVVGDRVIEIVHETGSTNADLAARLRSGENLPEGYWLVADRQSAGRGRQGRVWSDGSGNFMGSTVVRLGRRDPPASSLSLLAGIAVYEAVLPHCSHPQDLRLKWPNDLLLSGAKLAGILLHREGDAIVVGIGVNLACVPTDVTRSTAALAQFGPVPSRDRFADDLARAFVDELERWRQYSLDPLLARWSAIGHPPGTPMGCHGPDGERLSGVFAGLSDDGSLRLRLEDGTVRTIHAGDVMLERE